ncbi:Protein ALTERED XYLOGLUCAN 4 [Hibiscus syriacus]|uniref:Protein ALTERED XYLOGLUCAN 4 n=1 Tax=Hibiscus syriacus TaxID=106335 RepID=A0A6A2Z4U5_HIBSY|nr:Protein ALTERED XYLOGLUCAN 4 [Hibiscus syriacus]
MGPYTMAQPVILSKTAKLHLTWETRLGLPLLAMATEPMSTPEAIGFFIRLFIMRVVLFGLPLLPGLNHTEIGFYGVMRKAIKTALKTIIERKLGSGIDVFLTGFSPSHFQGKWDKAGACPKTEPYKEGEKMVEGMDADMRSIAVEEIEAANVNAKQFGGLRLEILDVTKLSLMRPDAHPGPYMYPFPFANGVQEHVQNDCVHWCLPGPIDSWNQIMLHVIRRWRRGD